MSLSSVSLGAKKRLSTACPVVERQDTCGWVPSLPAAAGSRPARSDPTVFAAMSGVLRGVEPVDPGYGIQGDQVRLRERRALLFHTIKRSGSGEEGWERAPEQQHIVPLNTEEIDPALPSGGGQETA